MKRDIILTCEYTPYNQKFFENLKKCDFEELKTIVHPLFCEVCCLTFDKIENVLLDIGAFKGGFVALTMNLNEERIKGSEHIYHSDMITFLDIHKKDYDQDPEKQIILFEDENRERVFSTQIYPIFLQDVSELLNDNMEIQDYWALIMKLTPRKKLVRKELETKRELKGILKYR